jgi:hypothetical protein
VEKGNVFADILAVHGNGTARVKRFVSWKKYPTSAKLLRDLE